MHARCPPRGNSKHHIPHAAGSKVTAEWEERRCRYLPGYVVQPCSSPIVVNQVRHLLLHAMQEIHIAEIDGRVPEVAKQFFPGMAVGFQDARVKVHICDGIT